MAGLRVGRVGVIFSLPKMSPLQHDSILPRNVVVPQYLAYVEWFTKFTRHPEPHHQLYRIRRDSAPDGGPLVSVLPVSVIERSVHLYPKWGYAVPSEWTSETVLDLAPSFLVSQFNNDPTYFKLYQ